MVVGFIVMQTRCVLPLGNLALLDLFCISLFSILLLSLILWISMDVILLLVILTFLINVFVLLLGLLTMSVCRCSYFSRSWKRIKKLSLVAPSKFHTNYMCNNREVWTLKSHSTILSVIMLYSNNISYKLIMKWRTQ